MGEQKLQCHVMSGKNETLASMRLDPWMKSEAKNHTIAVSYSTINRGRRVRELRAGFKLDPNMKGHGMREHVRGYGNESKIMGYENI